MRTSSTPPTSPALPTEADLAAAAHRSDPLADALADRVLADPTGWRRFDEALRHGADSAVDPAVRDLVLDLERTCAAADDEVLDAAAEPTFTASMGVHVFDVGAGALISSYRPPTTSTILVRTGRLLGENAHARLLETAQWLTAASLPSGTRPGRRGFVSTAHVRLGHAVVRRRVQREDPPADGTVPISQLDQLRTWLDFTYVAPQSAAVLGIDLTPAEYARFLRFWRHLGTLLGVEPGLTAGVVDLAGARTLHDRIDARTAAPNDDARALTASGLTVLATTLAELTPIPALVATPLVEVVSRAMQGDPLADALGIPRHPLLSRAVPVVAAVQRARRDRLRRNPTAWAAAIARNTAANREFLDAG
ncbi:oxygenase MpaB family protein [Kineococcus sp. R86509]|uniref:oxygenase MpaB family protein n=1 Tax=Kineococcus sp. R86509 TaxID=3093851 RepID=UPI0036D34ACB